MRIGWKNMVLEALITSSSENSSYPWSTALNDSRLSRVGRTDGEISGYIRFGYDTAIETSLVAILASNFTASAACNLYKNSDMTWTHRAAAGSFSNAFNDGTYGNGLYVIVGQSGEIQTSPDGITWTHRTAAGSYSGSFQGATYGNGLYVIVGNSGEIQTSPDGITWTHRTAAGSFSGSFQGATYGNGLYVIVGDSGEIQTSPDGITWTHRTADSSFSGIFIGATYGDELYVIAGQSGEIQTSTDGITWTHRTAAGSYSGVFNDATYGDELFVIVGQSGEIQTSPDGTTWTHRTAAGSYAGSFVGATYGDELFVIVGQSGEIQTSPDGITWTHRSAAGSFSGYFYGATYGNWLYIIVGTSGEIQTMDALELIVALTRYDDFWVGQFTPDSTELYTLVFEDPTNPDGYIEIAGIFLGGYLQLPKMKPDQELEDLTTSEVDFSSTGQAYGDEGYDYRNPKVNFGNMTIAQKDEFMEMWKDRKNIKPIVMMIWAERLDMATPLYCVIDQKNIVWKRTDDVNRPFTTSVKFREVF